MYAEQETRHTRSVTWSSDDFIYKSSRSLSGSFIDLDIYSVGFRSVCWQNCGRHWPTLSVPYVGRPAGASDQHIPFRMLADLRVPLTNTFLSVCWQNCGCHWPTPSVPYVGRTASVTEKHLPFLTMLADLRVPQINTLRSVCWQNCGCHWRTPALPYVGELRVPLTNIFRVVCWQKCGC